MLRTFKYRIYPNKKQQELLEKHFGCVRFIYNFALDKKIKAYETSKTTLTRFDLQVIVKDMKQDSKYYWLNEVNSQSLQAVLKHLDGAFTKFFREKKCFPKFKSKKNNFHSFECPQHVKIENNKLIIPKFLEGLRIRLSRMFTGKIKTTTISKTPTGKYYASVLVETDDVLPLKPEIKEETTVGIDLGIKSFVTISDGTKIESLKPLKNSLDKLKVLQKRLSRKVKESNNRKKARLKVAKIHEKITEQRNDYINKLTCRMVHDSQVDTICVENLNVQGMVCNHHLAQAISDASWNEFNQQLEYKCNWYGKNYVKIGRFDASSKICSVCGNINKELTLADREWTCTNCKTHHDRDTNAAINMKKFGLQKQNLINYSGQGMPVGLGELLSVDRAMNQE